MEDAPKLDWMYAGPAGHVNPEEYLTGRAVDKTFEQFKLGGVEPTGLDLPAPTLPRKKALVPKIQVDVARKVQEDPLLTIRRQEEERKAVLREQLLIQQRLSTHTKKTVDKEKESHRKGKRRKGSSESSEDSDLDSKLAQKLKQLKKPHTKTQNIDEEIARKLKKLKKRKERTSSSSSSSDLEDCKDKRHGKKHERSERYTSSKSTNTRYEEKNPNETMRIRPSSSVREEKYLSTKSRHTTQTGERNHLRDTWQKQRAMGLPKNDKRMKLSEEELEKRRKEMMDHAVVRDQERKDKVDRYRKEVEEEAGQLNANRPKEAAFVKKQLSHVTSNTTVEARIKANVFNIQRSVTSMESNFARR